MKQLRYYHEPLRPLLRDLISVTAGVARRITDLVLGLVSRGRRRSKGLATIGIVISLVVQMVLLWLLGEMVSLCIDLAELWVELAAKHLEITLDTTS